MRFVLKLIALPMAKNTLKKNKNHHQHCPLTEHTENRALSDEISTDIGKNKGESHLLIENNLASWLYVCKLNDCDKMCKRLSLHTVSGSLKSIHFNDQNLNDTIHSSSSFSGCVCRPPPLHPIGP